MTPEELVAIACPKIRDLGWAFYFAPETFGVGGDLGLDGFQFYFLGRGGVLGNVEPLVVSSAFGYFNPAMIADQWTAGSKTVAPRDAARAFFECAAAFGRSRFADIVGLDEFCAALEAVNDAADPVGLALYSAAKAQPLAEDLPGRAMQLVSVLREFRGSAHLIAIRAVGLDDKRAQFIQRPNDAAMFGWGPDDAPPITDEQRARLERSEQLTDELVLPAYSMLNEGNQAALLAGLVAIETVLAG